MAHEDIVRGHDAPRVAFDVASRRRWAGQANPDARSFCWIEPPELPWPLRFDFVLAEADDGTRRNVCVGFEVGADVPREDQRDTDEYEVTQERLAIIWANFHRYRHIAEALLIPTPPNAEEAVRMRTASRRRKREPWTPDQLADLVREYRARTRQPDRMFDLAAMYGVHRTQINRALNRAAREGLILESEIPRRPRVDGPTS